MASKVFIAVCYGPGCRSRPAIFINTDEDVVNGECDKWIAIYGNDIRIEKKEYDVT